MAGLVVLAVIALVVATLLVDPDTYRPTIQRELSEALGRAVFIERLSVGKSLYPTIAVDGVRIANAPWASQSDLVSVDSASVRLDLVSLVRGEVEIGSIEVDGVAISLERDSNGVGNWVLSAPSSKTHRKEPVELPDFDHISLHDVKVAWRNSDGSSIDVQVPSAEAALRAAQPLEIYATVVYRKVPIQAQLKARRSLQSALNGEPVSASLQLDAVRTHLDLSIDLTSLSDFGHFEATLAGTGERIGALSTLLDRDLPNWGPYAVSAKLLVNNGRLDVSGLRLTVDGLPGNPPFAIRKVDVNSGLVSLGSRTPTSLTLSGHLDEMDFVLDATTADVSSFRNGFEHVPISASTRVSGFRLGANGELRFSEDAFDFDFATFIKGDVGSPARIFGNVDLSKPLDVNLASQVSGNTRWVKLDALKGVVAKCAVAGEIAVHYSPRVRVDGGLELGRVDVAAFDVFGNTSRTPSPEKSESASSNWMSALDGNLRLHVREIAGLPVAASNLSARAVLGGGRLAVREFRGSVNDTQLLVTAGLQYKGDRPYIDADISLPVFDLARLPAAASDKKENQSGLDSPLPMEALRSLDADVKVAIAQIKGSPVSMQRLRASAHLQRGHLLVSALDATTAGVTSRSTLALDATSDNARLSATSQSGQIDLAALFKELGLKSDVLGRLADATVTSDTHGSTLRNWLQNAKVKATVGASVLKLRERNEELDIAQASVIAGPEVPVEAELRGKVEQYPLQLTARGGTLADLLFNESAWPEISAELRTQVKDQPVALNVSTALNSLRAGRDVPVRLELRSPNALTTVVGTIADLKKPASSPFVIKADVKSLATLPLLNVHTSFPDIPLKATGRLAFGKDLIALDGLQLKAGDTDLAGNVQFHRNDRQKLIVDLSGNLLDLKPWLPKPETETKQAETKQAETKQAESVDSKLDRHFDLSAMRKFDGSVTLSTKRLVAHRWDLDDFAVKAMLDRGILNYSVSIREGGTRVSGRINGHTDIPSVAFRAQTKNLDVESLKPADVAL
ncbi:MAG: AsmA family protein, partial [Burkholderiales bacterium]